MEQVEVFIQADVGVSMEEVVFRARQRVSENHNPRVPISHCLLYGMPLWTSGGDILSLGSEQSVGRQRHSGYKILISIYP